MKRRAINPSDLGRWRVDLLISLKGEKSYIKIKKSKEVKVIICLVVGRTTLEKILI